MTRAAVLAVLLVACRDAGEGSDRLRDTAVPAAPIAPANTPAAPGTPDGKASCPATGLWSPCAVVERLDRSGLVPRVDSAPVTEAPLTASGTLVRVGTSELELYVYPDADARRRDSAKLDATRYIEYSAPVSMEQQPTLIQSVNLIAVLHSRNDHQRERIGDALTAGPPQPPRP